MCRDKQFGKLRAKVLSFHIAFSLHEAKHKTIDANMQASQLMQCHALAETNGQKILPQKSSRI